MLPHKLLRKLADLKLSRQLLILAGTPVLAGIVCAITLGIVLFNCEHQRSTEQQCREVLNLYQLSKNKMVNACFDMLLYANTDDDSFLEMFSEAMSKSEKYVSQMAEKCERIPELERFLPQICQETEEFERAGIEYARTHSLGKRIAHTKELQLREDFSGTMLRMSAVSEQLRLTTQKLCESRLVDQISDPSTNTRLLPLVSVASALLAALTLWAVNENFVRRLQLMARGSRNFGATLRVSDPVWGTDELSELDVSLRHMCIDMRESLRKEHVLLNNAREVICVLSEDLKILSLNMAVRNLWGFMPEELTARSLTEVLSTESNPTHDELLTLFEEHGRSERSPGLELVVLNKEAHIVWTSWTIHWSEPDRNYFCVAHDITATKVAEFAVKQSEQRVTALINALPAGVLLLSAEGTIEFANRVALDLLGFAGETELAGRNFCEFLDTRIAIPTAQGMERLMQVLHDKPGMVPMRSSRNDMLNAELGMRTLTLHGTDKILSVFVDVSAQREAAKLKERLLAMLAHDIRTPLTTLQMSFYMAEQGLWGKLSQDGVTALARSRQGAEYAVDLIKQLLSFAKYSPDQLLQSLKEVEIDQLLDSIVETVEARLPNFQIEANSDSPVLAMVDPEKFAMVMTNLFMLIAKRTTEYNVCELRWTKINEFCEVIVECCWDDRLSDLVNEFVKERTATVELKPDLHFRGDFGLSVCQELVRQLGGTVYAERLADKLRLTICLLSTLPAAAQKPDSHTNSAQVGYI